MNYKQLIFSTLRGEPTETIPYIPRLDIWYNANKSNGTLPEKYKNAALRDITDDLGLGYHCVVPQFRDYINEDGDIHLGLGIYQFKTILYKVILHNTDYTVSRSGAGLTSVEYRTPYGKITTGVMYNDEMRKSGATLACTIEHAIKDVRDFKAIAYIFENIEVIPDYSHYMELKESVVGDRGIATGYANIHASPMHFILKELMSPEIFFYELYDHPEEMEWLAEKLSGYCGKTFSAAADSPAEVILSGANYDSSIISPPFFKKYVTPHLKKQSGYLHEKGKYLLTHTDGENHGLLYEYLESEIDIADSICPAPMTSLSLKQIKESFKGKITIYGGIPSISVLENSMSEYEFEKYLEKTLESVGKGDHIIFSIADTTPPGAKFERILRIAEKVREFGPVKI